VIGAAWAALDPSGARRGANWGIAGKGGWLM